MRKVSSTFGGMVAAAALLGLAGCSDCESCKTGPGGEVLAGATAAPGAAAGADALAYAGVKAVGLTVPAGSKRAVLSVEGMTCEGCASGIMAALQGVPGVKTAGVEYKSAEAWAVCSKDVPEAALIAAVEKHGYKVTVKSVVGG